ncbi:4'-phosphopantetheinyl transferase superfamily protein [Conexibacter stalactiti]|uniref:4'-phosphopantetheinyl transferase superfamily protein n=1 Tax=Conexibacter stalactiti TaxID=1940611 RepID=A0ABU4HJ75_9ACTN|nr:4'-phosphopantetheinyl transferase superfamily protein [Conexibacter stalactiti]MDW5593373.1 4'-phosphopantetheinyl transferase superfamily protein [Conexibacter stalactiti]MEC5034014.1 4'-phosphopantetheinyl transferase superfamily protein [Conexibacter stalactiti]
MSHRPAHAPADLRVWLVPVDAATCARFAPLLSTAERGRAARFRDPADGARFTVGRGALRLLLGRCLGIAPPAVELTRAAHGRPALAGGALDFNVAHAHRLVACAVSRTRRVGIDLEWIRVLREQHAVTALACDERERAWLDGLPPRGRRQALFELWTAKEACLKAIGCGLLEEPAAVAVALDPARPELPEHGAASFAGAPFALRRLPCPPGYRLTLATQPGGPAAEREQRMQRERVTPRRAAAAAPAGDPTGRRPRSSSARPAPAGRA